MDKSTFINRLLLKHPENFKGYNYDLVPANFSFKEKLPIICNTHGEFYQVAYMHILGRKCSLCTSENLELTRTKYSVDRFIEKSKSFFGDFFDYSMVKQVRKMKRITLICKKHGEVSVLPDVHFRLKTGCNTCEYESYHKKRLSIFTSRVRRHHGDRYDYSKVKFVNQAGPIEIVCRTHGSFFQIAESHARGSDCPTCATEEQRLTTDSFVERSKCIHGEDTYDYSKVVYTKNSEMVSIVCKKHGVFRQLAAAHLKGSRCRRCSEELASKGKDRFIEDSVKVHGDRYDYSKVVYKSNKHKVEVICRVHGSFFLIPNGHLSSRQGCRGCSDSKGEAGVAVFLKKYGIPYIKEYVIPPQRFRYDFYLPDAGVCIEFHGHQHYRPVEFFGGEPEYRKRVLHDAMKEAILKAKGIPLIVLSYQFLKEDVLEKQLELSLRKRFKVWLRINDEVKNFKTLSSLKESYGISDVKLDLKGTVETLARLGFDVKPVFSCL